MRTSRSGTWWLAVMMVALLAVGVWAQDYGTPSAGAPSTTTEQPAPGTATCPTAPGLAVGQTAPETTVVTPSTVTAVQGPAFVDYTRLWSNRPERTVTGRIASVSRFYPADRAMGPGITIDVTSGIAENDMVPDWHRQMMVAPITTVQLGPQWYVEQALPRLRLGQMVTVTGAPVTWHRRQVLLARQIQVGRTMIAMRDANGTPMWAGGWPAWGGPTAVARVFDPATITTVSGRIRRIRTGELAAGMGHSTMVDLITSARHTLRVDLAPPWYLRQAGVNLTRGQEITVTGSLVNIRGRSALLATSLQAGGQQYALRSAGGVPTWAVAMAPPQQAVIAQAQGQPGVAAPPMSGPTAGTQEAPPMPTAGAQEGTQTY